jgi:hypothetical protein
MYMAVAIGAVFGISFSFDFTRMDILLILLLVFLFTGVHAIVFGHSRYHIPLVGFLSVFASWAVLNLKTIWAKRKTFRSGVALCFSVLLVFIWAKEVVIEAARYLNGVAS